MSETPAPESIDDVLRSDHAAILEAAAALRTNTDTEAVGELFAQLCADVVRHFVAEEQYLWPLARRELADGDTLADDGFEQNRTCERALRLLEDDDLSADQLEQAMTEVRLILTDHVRGQEQTVFPALADKVEHAELVRLTDEVLGVEQIAPSRPRRVASESPAVSRAETVVEGFVDHLRDVFSRPRKDD
jgi:hemerythrin superfamily protein